MKRVIDCHHCSRFHWRRANRLKRWLVKKFGERVVLVDMGKEAIGIEWRDLGYLSDDI